MVVYPDGIWYSGLTPELIPEIVEQHFRQGQPVKRLINTDIAALKAEIDANRNRMISAMKARDDAGVLPDDLTQVIQGFRVSRIILTAIELDIFTAVGDGAPAEKVAMTLGFDVRVTETLLNALSALELLDKRKHVFYNTLLSSNYFVAGGKSDSRANLMHIVNLWDRWSTLTSCVRKGTTVTYQEQVLRPTSYTEAFIAAMHKNASFRAPQVARALNIGNVKRVLDVGGGSGAYSIAFARINQELVADVFDLPTVIPLTENYINNEGLRGRIKTRSGDMRTDDLGTGYDLVFISAICHMNSPEENIRLFEKSFKALIPGGRIVMQDFVLNSDKTSPQSGALFAINMLVGTKAGSSYSEEEYRQWLLKAHFSDIRKISLSGPTALIVAERF
jgi:cyclopropane fatty-acyl-phospholipid synthase-like methyltransferase